MLGSVTYSPQIDEVIFEKRKAALRQPSDY